MDRLGGPNTIFGTFGQDDIRGTDNTDVIIGRSGNDKINGGGSSDLIFGALGNDTVEGGDGDDAVFGGFGDDVVLGNTGDDNLFGGRGNDLIVWNNGDGSDLIDGGDDTDTLQVNFNTDLVDNDLQNDDVAVFSQSESGVQFARTTLNDQTASGLFKLDIRNTETLVTNFGDGADTARLEGDILNAILLDLDGGAGVDTLDLFSLAQGVNVDLATGALNSSMALNFENVTGTLFNDTIAGDAQDNVIRGGGGNDIVSGGDGADTFVFLEQDAGVVTILDFELGVDRLSFGPVTSNADAPGLLASLQSTGLDATTANAFASIQQVGTAVEMTLGDQMIRFENTLVGDVTPDTFMLV